MKKIQLRYFSIKNLYMKFQNPSLYVQKLQVAYKKCDKRTNKQMSKQAKPTFS